MTFRLFQYFQLFSLITAIHCFKYIKQFKLAAFLPMMILVVVTEAVAANCIRLLHFKNNYGVYDVYIVIYTPLMLYIIYQMLLYKGINRVLYISVSIFTTLLALWNILGFQGIKNADTYSFLFVEFVVTIASLLAIVNLFLDDDNDAHLLKHPYFWINGSTILFSVGTLLSWGLQQYLFKRKIMLGGVGLTNFIMPKLNYFLYSAYAYAFILCRTLTSKPS